MRTRGGPGFADFFFLSKATLTESRFDGQKSTGLKNDLKQRASQLEWTLGIVKQYQTALVGHTVRGNSQASASDVLTADRT